MNGYELSRAYWDFVFENPDKVKPGHCAIYFFAIEHCNRLGWKGKFGLPATMVMEATGIKSYNTYKILFTDLVDWGFFKLVKKSVNQYSSNIIALSKSDKANDEALDKAVMRQMTKQMTNHLQSTVQSTVQSIDSINKPITNKPIKIPFESFWNLYDKKIDPKKSKPKWDALTIEQQTKAMAYIPAYKASLEDKTFQRHPVTFINNHTWDNEIVVRKPLNGVEPKPTKTLKYLD